MVKEWECKIEVDLFTLFEYNKGDLKGWFARSKMFARFFEKILKKTPFCGIRSKMYFVPKVSDQFRCASENRRFSPVFFVFLRFPRFFENSKKCDSKRCKLPFSLFGVDSDVQIAFLRQILS